MTEAGRWAIVAAGTVALVTITIGLGLFWVRRRVAQVAAADEAALLRSFAPTTLPSRGEVVQVLLQAGHGRPTIVYASHDPALGWRCSDDIKPLAGRALGWRPDPFNSARDPRIDDMSDEEIGTALAAMTRGQD